MQKLREVNGALEHYTHVWPEGNVPTLTNMELGFGGLMGQGDQR